MGMQKREISNPLDVEIAHTAVQTEPQSHSPNRTALFILFCCVRAIHPSIITASKESIDGKLAFPFHMGTPLCIAPFVIFVVCILVTIKLHGSAGLRTLWMRRPLFIYIVNGAMLALDDWLEMESLKNMHGAPYQVLCQSKIIIIALLSMPLKGVYQTRSQWMLLVALVCGMSLYTCQGSDDSDDDIPFYAYMIVLTKVTWSCFAAVYVDKFTKEFAQTVPLSVQMAQAYFARWIFTCLLVSSTTPVWSNGFESFFHGWNVFTIGVIVSFCVKGTFSFVLVALLDAILKTMGECVAVLLIYFYSVSAPWDRAEFDISTFLAVMVIILVISVYADSKHGKPHAEPAEKRKPTIAA